MKTIILFIAILFCLSGCSRSPEDLYQEGKSAEQQKNFPTALERYAQVVEKDPESAYAESSQYRIAILYNNELREIEKAALAYKKFYTLFPKSKDAPTCLFLAGFLYNNDLKKHEVAKEIYLEFMQKFPNHELISSAKFEIETIGKDPGELIKKDTTLQTAKQVTTDEKKHQ